MKVLLVGSGGREHCLIKSIKKNKDITEIYALPGNGGISMDATCVDIKATDIDGICEFAKNHDIDFAVVAPDDPLVMGAVDRLEDMGIPCFGPRANAAIIEGSKVFSKNLMKKYSIPTAEYEVFDNYDDALNYLDKCSYPTVIKADGLALGKGVIIAQNHQEAKDALGLMMQQKAFGNSGNTVVIEQFLTGPEVSVLAFTDSKSIVPMVSSMDHKRIGNGNTGLNTGGMGTIAPNPFYTKEIAERCLNEIFLPTINAMNKEGRPFKGCLYFGLMLTPNGPKVIEYNCRFGDPETQVVLPLLKTDLFEIMKAVSEERLSEINVEFYDECACCVVIASGGYPTEYKKGLPMKISCTDSESVTVFHAGTKFENNEFYTNGGRVIGVTAKAPTLKEAIDIAYENAQMITFENCYMRNDIGSEALKETENGL